jgi:predicted kinase
MTKTLILIRGLPNSGKTTLAAKLGTEHVFSFEDFFVTRARNFGCTYEEAFDKTLVYLAERLCQANTYSSMEASVNLIVVHAPFAKKREVDWYLQTASTFDYEVHVLTLEKHHPYSNDGGPPQSSIDKMISSWHHFDPRFSS